MGKRTSHPNPTNQNAKFQQFPILRDDRDMTGRNKRKPCPLCGAWVAARRLRLGYRVCTTCGEAQAAGERRRWLIVPLGKSNYQLLGTGARDAAPDSPARTLLRCLNPKTNNAE